MISPGAGADSGAYDPLDLQLEQLRTTIDGTDPTSPVQVPSPRLWSSGSVQATLLLLLGAAFGQHGLAFLTPRVLTLLDPAIPVALAALGVLVAFQLPTRGSHEARLLVAATLQAALTGLVVATGTWLTVGVLLSPAGVAPWVPAAIAGVAAAMSSSLPARARVTAATAAHRVRELDAVLPIVTGGVLVAAALSGGGEPAQQVLARAAGITLMIAVAGWLLLTRASSDIEQRVFTLATLLFLGGVADYLSLSALMCGGIAGLFWQWTGGVAREAMRRDLGHVQHPLVALVLLAAGARLELSQSVVALTAGYIVVRALVKLVAGRLVRRFDARLAPGFGASLVAPGVLGVAFALNATRMIGPETAPILSVVVLGTIGSQLLAGAAARPAERMP